MGEEMRFTENDLLAAYCAGAMFTAAGVPLNENSAVLMKRWLSDTVQIVDLMIEADEESSIENVLTALLNAISTNQETIGSVRDGVTGLLTDSTEEENS